MKDKEPIIGHVLHRRGEVTSTMHEAWKLVEEGAPDGTVVVALRQQEGKGRLDRCWFSPEGGLYLSVILRPSEVFRGLSITLLAALAMAEAILEQAAEVPIAVEWPNDLMIGPKKVGGVIAEVKKRGEPPASVVVLGLGVNVLLELDKCPDDVEMRATSLQLATGRFVAPEELLWSFCAHLTRRYGDARLGDTGRALARIKELANFLDRDVRITEANQSFYGRAVDVDPLGVLVVKKEDGELERVYSAEMKLV